MADDLMKRLSKSSQIRAELEEKKKEKAGDLVSRDRPRFWWFTMLVLGMAMMALGLIVCLDVAQDRPQPQGVVMSFGVVTAVSGLACISVFFHRWGKL